MNNFSDHDLESKLSMNEYQAILTALNKTAIVSITDALGEILYVNDKFVDISGYSRDELIGQNHRILKSSRNPEKLYADLWRTITSGKPWHGEIENKAKDGSYYWVDTTIAPILDDTGKIVRFVSIRFLITDKKQNEEKLSKQNRAVLNILEDLQSEKAKLNVQVIETSKFMLAVESANEHIVITDIDGIVLYANQAAERTTGYSREEILHTKAGVLWGGLMDSSFYRKLWTTIKVEKKAFKGEVNNIRKNGVVYIADATISPVLDKDGNIMFFVGIERDVTNEKNIDKAKTEFVSLASHQLRTPLTAINWYSELLESGDEGQLNEAQKKYLEEIHNGSKRMSELVSSLLNVSRIELGTFAVDPEMTDVVLLLRSVLDELKLLTDEKKLTISVDHDELPQIMVDPKLLRMVYQNILTNAVKYTPPSGALTITQKRKDDQLLVTIQDTGYGIPKDQQSKIFTKLFRADNVRDKDTQGTGLGLYIVKSIVDQSGGKIWFESEEGKGTTFFIEMPMSGMKAKEGSKPLE